MRTAWLGILLLGLWAPLRAQKERLPQAQVELPRIERLSWAWQAVGDVASELPLALPAVVAELAAEGSGLRLVYDTRSLTGRHIRYQQTLWGDDVVGGGVTVHLSLAGAVRWVEKQWVATGATRPSSLSPLALARAPADWRVAHEQAAWLPVGGELRRVVCREVNHPSGRAERWTLDAATGGVIRVEDLATYLTTYLADTSGRARVFRPDPLSTAGVAYAATPDFRHNGGATNSALDAQRREVVLRGLTYTGGAFVLDGPHVRLRELGPPTSPISTTPDGDFSADRSQPRFTDAMAYFYVDSMQRYVQSLGFTTLRGSQGIRVDPRGDVEDQSFFVGGTDPVIHLGVGGVPDAEDADVIVHEYAHALSYWAAPGSNVGHERRGLDEGMADYLAVSFSEGLTPFGADQVFNWDGHNEFWNGRPATDSSVYDPATAGTISFYRLGSMWCGALMAARAQLGQAVVDRVQLETLFYHTAGMTLRQAARQLVTVDSLLYGTTHRSVWTETFCRRGLWVGPECPLPPPTPPPTDPFAGLERRGALDAWLLPDQQTLRLTVEAPEATWQLVNPYGQVIATGRVSTGVTDLALSAASSGLYVLRLTSGSAEVFIRVPLLR